MAGERDVDQIEYRWDPVKDMSPVVSSMSAESTQGWDPRVRPWVRHPSVDAPSESVCYRVFPTGTAALAWRYRDRQAAERKDGAQGRPLVSRVLVGQASLLSPDVAMVLCRTGLPAAAGPALGQAAADGVLPQISVGELADLVNERAAELDEQAAREKGLPKVVAAALSDPDTPLAIQLRDPYIFCTPREGSQSLLLWGLWRTVWPLLGPSAAQRGWSFSTFELPMGDVDASTLPDIVFRIAQAAPTVPPTNARREIRVRPGDLSAPTAGNPYAAELAEWLVSEYQETSGDELGELIAEWSSGHPPESRLANVYDVLRAKRSPVSVSGPAAPFVPLAHAREPLPEPAAPGQSVAPEIAAAAVSSQVAEFQLATIEPASPHNVGLAQALAASASRHLDETQHLAVPPPADTPEQPGARGRPEAPEHPDTASYREAPDASRYPNEALHPAASVQSSPAPDEPPPRPLAQPAIPSPAAAFQPRSTPDPAMDADDALTRSTEAALQVPVHQAQQAARYDIPACPVRNLLTGLDSDTDNRVFQSILQSLLGSTAEYGERVEARRQMPKSGWYIHAFKTHGYEQFVDELASIFRILVIPDLERPRVAAVLHAWVRNGPPEVTGALLAAAKAQDEVLHSEYETFQLMAKILGRAGLQKLLEISGIPFEWPSLPAGSGSQPGNQRTYGGPFARLFAFLGRKRRKDVAVHDRRDGRARS